MRAVRRLLPHPQVFCAFHTRSVGGLCVAPAPAAQIWGEAGLEKCSVQRAHPQANPSPTQGRPRGPKHLPLTVTACPAFRVNFGGKR